jgi:hypothetical protein
MAKREQSITPEGKQPKKPATNKAPAKKRAPRKTKKTEDKVDPRQLAFLEFYLDPDSLSYGNVFGAAQRAKYSESYAKVLANRGLHWLSENIRKETGPTSDEIIDKLWSEAKIAMRSSDRIKALEVLAKIRKMFSDGTNITVNSFGTTIFNVSEADDEQLDKIIRAGFDITIAAGKAAPSGRSNGTHRAPRSA